MLIGLQIIDTGSLRAVEYTWLEVPMHMVPLERRKLFLLALVKASYMQWCQRCAMEFFSGDAWSS